VLDGGELLGEGGEAQVFALGADRVLRRHRQPAPDHARTIGRFLDALDREALPFALPTVLEVGEDDVGTYAIERRLPGRSLDDVLPSLRGADRSRALRAYIDAAAAIRRLGLPDGWRDGFGEVFMEPPVRSATWKGLLEQQVRRQLALASDAPPGSLERALAAVSLQPEPSELALVHGDYCPGNVMIDADLEVTAVIDWSWLCVVGDADHELRTAALFTFAEDAEEECAALLGPAMAARLPAARVIEAARFVPYAEHQRLHAWCLEGLRPRPRP
jgi:aminoglycoside phosphotransferase (APT) family kinase protein